MSLIKFLNSAVSSSSFLESVEIAPSAITAAETKIGTSALIAIAMASDGLESTSVSFPFESSRKMDEK